MSTTALTHPSSMAVMPVLNGSGLASLDAYIQAVNRIPLLTAERESELGRKLRDTGDLGAARELILSHLRLVVSLSRQYLGYGLPQADLIQEGNVGLMKAVKRFDPERGVRLVSFAVHWIKAEIHEYIIRNWKIVKVATTKAQRKLFFNLRSMRGDGHLAPSRAKQIAETLNVKQEDVIEMEGRLMGYDVALDPMVSESDEYSTAPIAYLASPDAEPTQVIADREREALLSVGVPAAVETLDPRSRAIIEARWLAPAESQKTLHELAAEFGVSAERIRQIEAKALQKLKAALAAQGHLASA